MYESCRVNRTWLAVRSIALCAPLLLIVGLTRPALAAPGDLDSSFSGDGKVTTLMGTGGIGHAGVAQSVAIQSDGMIVAAGQVGGGNQERFALARYQTNGSLDPAFGSNGKVTTPFGSLAGASSVAIQPSDGMIVVVGWKFSGSSTRFAIARYQTDGTLDPTFGTNGKVTTPIGSNSSAASVAIQSDGMIVVAGSALVSNNTRFALARYQTNGSLDPTFGTNGKVHTPIGLASEALSVGIQSDGMIVVAGYSTGVSNSRFAVARYQTTGLLDPVFGSSGKVVTPFGSPSTAAAASVAIQTDGRIVAAGYSGSGTNSRFALARYLATGALDPTFGGTGKVTTTLGPYSQGTSLVIQPTDGKIVVAGNAIQANNGIFAVARYDPATGGLDTTFGNAGKVKTLIGSSAYASCIAIQADGRIVVAGQGSTGSHFRFAVARYLN